MKRLLSILFLFASCYTVTQKRDDDFLHMIKLQAELDSVFKTSIELKPKKVFFGKRKNSEQLTGFFYIKNTGHINFNLLAIKANCDCIDTDFKTTRIAPNDSIKILYQVHLKNRTGFISNSIVAIGNCQFGNQTFLLEGTIINN
jgi:hypothetical protein